MICSVYGQDYGLTHNCAGVAPAVVPEDIAPRPTGFAPLYYLTMACRIARWDDVAIRRASRDPLATAYGAFLWLVAVTAIYLRVVFRFIRIWNDLSPTITHRIILGFIFALVISAILTAIQIGLCHLIAKLFLGGHGSFVGVLRPLLLAWFVNLLVLYRLPAR